MIPVTWLIKQVMLQYICKQKALCYQHEAWATSTVAVKFEFKTALLVKAKGGFLFVLLLVVIVDIRQQCQQKAPEQYH
ncbi:hypothetical protein CO680_03935 [Weissella paramesenteroides]|mgnify:FL=1|uniref:Uncharacterized protein n=1 Tax=Weissella paramesenteroides ATCC 33313 TaxID=585506 RepID=C5RBY4_WEIPA|nr:hypothetical protein CO680_03935 [Weissella paramesenteroides]EER74321.1 hypothetical protein HMPREF0877_1480 [Weissella paramesenteroides ATCC 33313]